MSRKGSWILVAVLLAQGSAQASGPLDQKRIHALYNEGEFEKVIGQIARFRQENPRCSRDDSVFIAKHLAVVYAANPESVGQGKYWMNELLKLMPAADLVGMYVSDEIDRIFENVRKEFLSRQNSFGVDTGKVALPERPKEVALDTGNIAAAPSQGQPSGAQASGIPPRETASRPTASAPAEKIPAAAPRMENEKRSALKRAYWIAGGSALGATAVGLTAYLILSSSHPSAPDKEITIPRNPQTP